MFRARSEMTDNLLLIASDNDPGADRATLFSDTCAAVERRLRNPGCPALYLGARAVAARTRPVLDPSVADTVGRLERHPVAHLPADHRRPPARHRRRRGVLRLARGVSGDHCAGLLLRPVRRSLDHRRQSADAGADAAGGLVPDRAGPDRAGAGQGHDGARRELPVRPGARDLERQCRREGRHRRA